MDFPILGTEPFPVEFANTRYGGEATDLLAPAGAVRLWFSAYAATHGTTPVELPDRDAARARALRDHLRRFLDGLADGTHPGGDTVAALNDHTESAYASVRLEWPEDGRPDLTWRSAATGTTRALAELATEALMLAAPEVVVRRCAAPDCWMLFVADHGRRRFCHPGCSQRVRQARYQHRRPRSAAGHADAKFRTNRQGVSMNLTFRRVTRDDFGLLARWLDEPHVQRWWNHETSPEAIERDFGASVDGTEPSEDWLVLADGDPVALVQRCRWHDYPEDVAEASPFTEIPPGAASLDYFVGEPTRTNQGLGTTMLATMATRTWTDWPDVTALVIPVNAANRRSWRTLERAGFHRVAEGPLKPDNPVDDPLHYVLRLDRPAS